jgi:transposase
MSEHTYDSRKSTQVNHIEVVSRAERRRRWSDADKQRMLQETLAPGATVTAVAKRHGVGTGQIYTWRRQALAGAVGGFVPVMIGESSGTPDGSPPESALPEPRSIPSQRGSLVEIKLPSGIRLRVDSNVDGAALRRIVVALEGR